MISITSIKTLRANIFLKFPFEKFQKPLTFGLFATSSKNCTFLRILEHYDAPLENLFSGNCSFIIHMSSDIVFFI